MQAATAQDWKALPMPAHRQHLTVSRNFTPLEAEKIALGLIPEEMEDKWFIYFDAPFLHFHRSWTGFEIFRVELQHDKNGNCEIVDCWANRDSQQYRYVDDEFDIQQLHSLIDFGLLKRNI